MLVVRWAATGLFVVAVPLFLLLSNVRVAALEPRVSEYSFSRYDAEARTGIDRAELDRAGREIARYFVNGEALLAIRVTVDGADQALFNPRETDHMRDVKALFGLAFRVHEAAFVYAIAYVGAVVLWSRERSMRRLARQCVAAGVLTAGLLAAAGVAVLVAFDTLFRDFHLLSFDNDDWLLDPATDRLIQMFPQEFWFDVSLATGAATAVEGLLLALAAGVYLLATRSRAGDEAGPVAPAGAATEAAG